MDVELLVVPLPGADSNSSNDERLHAASSEGRYGRFRTAASSYSPPINRQDWGISYRGMADDLIKDEVLIKLNLLFPPPAAA